MKNVLVLGDWISDRYEMHTAERLCPEGPVPVLKHTKSFTNSGGAGLVVDQLGQFDWVTAYGVFGSRSTKTRIFADDHLLCRIDNDSHEVVGAEQYLKNIEKTIQAAGKIDAVIISDYGKGALSEVEAFEIMEKTQARNIPVFVDAKKHWNLYEGAFAAFPNEHEAGPKPGYRHVIQKLGSRGCEVDGLHVPTKAAKVIDVCGAGDCFIAAFVANWLDVEFAKTAEPTRLRIAAEFANEIAGISVQHVGTHAVAPEEYR